MIPQRLRAGLRRQRERHFLWRWRRRIGAHRFAQFGERSLIVEPRGILNPHRITIGDGVFIHENAMFSVVEDFNGRHHEPSLRIGSGTQIGRGIWFSCVGDIEIGEDTLMSHNILIADSYHEYHDPDTPIIRQPMAEPQTVRIGRGCFVGPHVAILAGVTVGENTFIAASSVLTSSVPANSVVVGNPARVIRRYDRERAAWVDVADPDGDRPAGV